MTLAYVGLGSNLQDPPRQLRSALTQLSKTRGLSLGPVSRFYRSAPLGPAGQPEYCNAVCALETALDAERLLDALQAIEAAAGRVRGERWGARVLDLDLLWMQGEQRETPRLSLPHPQLHLRAFVLVPLAELAPELILPGRGAVEDLAAGIDRSGLAVIGPAAGP